MAEIKAFKALRFTPKAGEIKKLVCPPYDIISEKQKQNYIEENEHNIIRLELPEQNEHGYKKAGELLNKWINEGILQEDHNAGFYIYEEEFKSYGKNYKVKGLIARVRLEEFEKGIILPHEETLSKAKSDRLNLMKATGCNFSSIYSLYFDEDKKIFSIVDKLSSKAADIQFTDDDNITHRVWCVYDSEYITKLEKLFEDKKLYIADGHHRYETALNYRNYINEQKIAGSHEYQMMTLVNMENPGLVVYPTHRIVKGLENFNAEELIEKCKKYFNVESTSIDSLEADLQKYYNEHKAAFGVVAKGKTAVLVLKDKTVMTEKLANMSDAYRGLDVSILHTLILEEILGIDKENMASQKNLTYTRDFSEAIGAVGMEDTNCSFIINATRVDEIAAVANNEEKMPQKSTYFYPKLITGHIMNKIL